MTSVIVNWIKSCAAFQPFQKYGTLCVGKCGGVARDIQHTLYGTHTTIATAENKIIVIIINIMCGCERAKLSPLAVFDAKIVEHTPHTRGGLMIAKPVAQSIPVACCAQNKSRRYNLRTVCGMCVCVSSVCVGKTYGKNNDK